VVTILLPTLSPQQGVILPLLADGFTVPEIGPRMFLSPNTVKTHVASLREKLNARNTANIIHLAHCLDLLDRPRKGVEPTPGQKLAWINRWLAEPEVVRLVVAERAQS
jgi:DNA-binding CsgD family transcriptional regulator